MLVKAGRSRNLRIEPSSTAGIEENSSASICAGMPAGYWASQGRSTVISFSLRYLVRSEEHTSELQSLMRISYAVFCLKKKKNIVHPNTNSHTVFLLLL